MSYVARYRQVHGTSDCIIFIGPSPIIKSSRNSDDVNGLTLPKVMYPRSSKEHSGFLAFSGILNRFGKSSIGLVIFCRGYLPVKNAFDPKTLSTQSDLLARTKLRRYDRIDMPVELIVNSLRVLSPTAQEYQNERRK